MIYPLPLLMFALGLLVAGYAQAAKREIGAVRWWLFGAALFCCAAASALSMAWMEVRSLLCGAMVGVLADEIDAFRRIFEEALRRADISLSKAAIWLYGSPDHGRLRHELERGALSAVRITKLPPEFQEPFIELMAAHQNVSVVTLANYERVVRLQARAQKPKPAAMQEASCTTRQAS